MGGRVHQTCHSAKRTHFIFVVFAMYQLCWQRLMLFAVGFANGFVLEKRTHFGGVFSVLNTLFEADKGGAVW